MNKTLIIGRGLAGSILSLKFQQTRVPHDIIDFESFSTSSKIAAGVVNPVVLKRLKIVQHAQQFLDAAHPFYQYWESKWDAGFYHQLKVEHLFHDVQEVNKWLELSDSPSHQSFLGSVKPGKYSSLKDEHGIGEVEQCGWMDTERFLQLHLQNLPAETGYFSKSISENEIGDLCKKYDKVIIANGHLARKLYPKLEGIFSPTRGEVMIIESHDLPESNIIHGPVFILPLGNKHFKVGATYHWDQLDDNATPEGLEQLKTKLEKIFTGQYKVVSHLAGVRPNVKDRKPLLGHLKDNLYLFNGLGSRGVLMAPKLAEHFADYLYQGKPLPDEFDIKRFLIT